jgi:hypothetical protein
MAPAPRDDVDDRSSRQNRLGSRFQDAWTHVVPYSNLGNNFAVTDCQSRFQDVAVERFLFLCLLILVSPDELYMYMHTNPEPLSPLRPAPCRFPFLLPPCVLVDIPCEHRKSRSHGDRTVTDKRPMCSASTGRQSPTPIRLGIAAASDRFDNSHGVSCALFFPTYATSTSCQRTRTRARTEYRGRRGDKGRRRRPTRLSSAVPVPHGVQCYFKDEIRVSALSAQPQTTPWLEHAHPRVILSRTTSDLRYHLSYTLARAVLLWPSLAIGLGLPPRPNTFSFPESNSLPSLCCGR